MITVPPEVMFRTKRIGQAQGKETVLECLIKAHPQSVSEWKKNGEPVFGQNQNTWQKYRTNIYTEDLFTIALYLTIINLSPEDFGVYTCEASNSFGKDKEDVTLYGRCIDVTVVYTTQHQHVLYTLAFLLNDFSFPRSKVK